MSEYITRSPVLLLIYNRPDLTKKVFNIIKKVKPGSLFISADGPKENKSEDKILCAEAQAILKDIDWPCNVQTLINTANKGCKTGVSDGISWFFQQVDMGIILEDDCFPSVDFFRFCDDLLEKYKDDARISMISGCNFQNEKKWGNNSYYFSKISHVWGWASWKRSWKDYDVNLSAYNEADIKRGFQNIFNDHALTEHWCDIFIRLKRGEIDTWDYQFGIMNFMNNRLSIIPNHNLISNIGFRKDATHTRHENDPNADLPISEMDHILSHPKIILPELEADMYTLRKGVTPVKKSGFFKRILRSKR